MPSTNTEYLSADEKSKCKSVQDIQNSSDAAASQVLNWAAARLSLVDQLIKDVLGGSGIMAETASYHLA